MSCLPSKLTICLRVRVRVRVRVLYPLTMQWTARAEAPHCGRHSLGSILLPLLPVPSVVCASGDMRCGDAGISRWCHRLCLQCCGAFRRHAPSLFLSPSLSFFVSFCLSLPLANGRDAMFYSVHTCAKPNVNDPGLSTLVLLSR